MLVYVLLICFEKTSSSSDSEGSEFKCWVPEGPRRAAGAGRDAEVTAFSACRFRRSERKPVPWNARTGRSRRVMDEKLHSTEVFC